MHKYRLASVIACGTLHVCMCLTRKSSNEEVLDDESDAAQESFPVCIV
jgi:hypothetical protein